MSELMPATSRTTIEQDIRIAFRERVENDREAGAALYDLLTSGKLVRCATGEPVQFQHSEARSFISEMGGVLPSVDQSATMPSDFQELLQWVGYSVEVHEPTPEDVSYTSSSKMNKKVALQTIAAVMWGLNTIIYLAEDRILLASLSFLLVLMFYVLALQSSMKAPSTRAASRD